MRILFLTKRFFPEIGGVEKHVLEVSKVLSSYGHDVKIIAEYHPNFNNNKKNIYQSIGQSDTYTVNLKQAVKSVQTKILRLYFGKENWFKKFRIWIGMVGILRDIKNADVIHCHDVFFWYLPFRFIFPLKKVFITFHGYETKFPPTLKAKIIRKISEKLSNGNICVGEFIEKWYGTRPNYITNGGVSKIQNSKFKIQKFDKNRKKIILLLGRLEEDNGVSLYIEALKLLKKKGTKFEFVACGDGRLRREVEKYGIVQGFIEDLSKHIDRASIVLCSSYLSILETLIRKKPVFAVYQNELKKDYLKMSELASFINIFSNARDLASAILNGKQTQKIDAGYLWASKQTWGKVADIYLRLWEK